MAIWPIAGSRAGANVTNRFGGPQARAPGMTGTLPSSNVGLDIAAQVGTPLVAPVDGTVVEEYQATAPANVNENHGYGGSVLIRGDDGSLHRLSHQAPGSIVVQKGQRVRAGQPVGAVGHTGNTRGAGGGPFAHLDYEFKPRGSGGGFADPLSQEFSMSSYDPRSGADAPHLQASAPGGPPPLAGGPGGPGPRKPPREPDPNPDRERILAQLDAFDADLVAAEADPSIGAVGAALIRTRQAQYRETLFNSLTAISRSTTPAARDAAAQAADDAQAAYAKEKPALEREAIAAANQRSAADIASAQAIAAGRNATDLQQTGMTTGTQREVAQLQVGGSLLETQIRDATERARLTWEQEKGRIEEALGNRKLTLEEATAAAGESRDRIANLLTQQRNAIELAGVEATQRGQDITAATTQRGQDLEAGVGVRGQDIGRLNQFTQSGSSLLGQAMQTAGGIGEATGRTALGALGYYGPKGSDAYISAVRAGQPATPPPEVGMPFNPLTVVQQAAEAAYAKYAPPGQQLLGAGMGPSPAFVAPGQIAPPPRVASPFSAIGLPPSIIRPNLGQPVPPTGGGFTAP